MVAEACVSNIVFTQELTKTVICLKSVMVCLILLGHECIKVMDKAICSVPFPKAFFLWSKKGAKIHGKQVLQSGVEFASDVVHGKNVKQAAID